MNNILDLYKEHINPEPDGAEIHHFLTSFNLARVMVADPEHPMMDKFIKMYSERDMTDAKRWILENSRKHLMNSQPSHSPVSDDGQAPIVEFLTVRGNLEEAHERERLIGMGSTPEFACKEDYMTSIVIDMDNVIDYCLGKTYMNGQELDCVYPNMYGIESPPLLCSPEVFKRIYEESRNLKIKSFQEWK